MNEELDWKRFWCKPENGYSLSDGGYLADPDAEFGSFYNPNVVAFDAIDRLHCLVLLGEPGIGKSHAMRTAMRATEAGRSGSGREALWLDLHAIGSETTLFRQVFDNPDFTRWASGDHDLCLFLDSLDECLLRVGTIAAILAGELRKYQLGRLSLRIACRTAEWPRSFENQLRDLWGADETGVYELTPLRRCDVRHAAVTSALDPVEFLQELDRAEAVPFAIKPVTLRLLINTRLRTSGLPSSQAELYLKGCRTLCEETNIARAEGGLRGYLSPDQRLSLASRIAAITLFANRSAVWTAPDIGDVPQECVTLHDLAGSTEDASGNQFNVDEAAIREALSTGLFSSRGQDRMGWAHQTYAEFLAASYVVQHKMDVSQMTSLLVHPGDPDGRLVPQLHGVAAWLATMSRDVFQEVRASEPEVLLLSDVSAASTEDKAKLTEVLLDNYGAGKLVDSDFRLRRRYRGLCHPGLAEQLRPFIRNAAKESVVRRVATDIAESCGLTELQDEFVAIALDSGEPILDRVNAAAALARVGDAATRSQLRPLLYLAADDDPQEELKGWALRELWPEHLSAEDFFQVLNHPRSDDYFGSYWMFLVELPENIGSAIAPDDLPVALRWVLRQVRSLIPRDPVQDIIDVILALAWQNLDVGGVAESFAEAALVRLEHSDHVVNPKRVSSFAEQWADNSESRRRVLAAMVSLAAKDAEACGRALMVIGGLVKRGEDVQWLLDRLSEAVSEEAQRAFAELLDYAFDSNDVELVAKCFLASEVNPILRRVLSSRYDAIELDSADARRLRERQARIRQFHERSDQMGVELQLEPQEQVLALLEEIESGNVAAWWRLSQAMLFRLDGAPIDGLASDLTISPIWVTSDPSARARIVETAKEYVLRQCPDTAEWLGTNTFYFPAAAGVRALRLLLNEAPSFIDGLAASVWEKWAPAIIAYPGQSETEDTRSCPDLLRLAYRFAPDQMIDALLTVIDKEKVAANSGGHLFILRAAEVFWDDRVANALLEKAKSSDPWLQAQVNLLSALLDHQVAPARSFADSLVPLHVPTSGPGRALAIEAAGTLITHTKDAGWSTVWPAFQHDTAFGRDVILSVAQTADYSTMSIQLALSEQELADFYTWLVRVFPYSEEQRRSGLVTPRQRAEELRDSVLRYLEERGTEEACIQIERVMLEFPTLAWLRAVLLRARTLTRQRTWMPPRPGEILALSRDQESRRIENGKQLMTAVAESLRRLEGRLQGETPAAPFLWDKVAKERYRPKDENYLSDYVKLHLEADIKERGIVVNREVEIRRGEGGGKGERTDVLVEAVARNSTGDTYQSVKAIVEVKGCWHRELFEAMQTQLVKRYLSDNQCQDGLYLVGWYDCPQWDQNDPKYRRAPKIGMTEAQRRFDTQASGLSRGGTLIQALVINVALR